MLVPPKYFVLPFLYACFLVSSLLLFIDQARAADDSELEAQIESYIKSLRHKGVLRSDERTAWFVYDFTTKDKLVSINEHTSLQAASMIKPYLALAFFHQVKQGKLSYGPASRRKLELMIQKSNNEATNWVMRQTGGPSATLALLKKHYPAVCRQIRLVEYIPKNGRTYRNQESAGDYSRFLYSVWKGKLPYSREILRLMGLPGTDRLCTKVKRVPSGTKVFNKTGSTAMCCGDMGILIARGRNGRSYPYLVVGIIESKKRNKSYGPWISKRASVIREVSNLIYLSMTKRHAL